VLKRQENGPQLLVFYDKKRKAWVLNAGMLHGMPQKAQGKVSLYLFDEFYRGADEPRYALAEVALVSVDATVSLLGNELSHLDKTLIFRAYFKEVPRHEIAVHEQQGRLSIWSEKSMLGLKDCWKSLYTETKEEAEVLVSSSDVIWKRYRENLRLEAPMTKAPTPVGRLNISWNASQACERLIALDNADAAQSGQDIQCRFTFAPERWRREDRDALAGN
jgi:hypothetical protein